MNFRNKYSQELHLLILATQWADSADDEVMIFFFVFPENRIWHFMQIVS